MDGTRPRWHPATGDDDGRPGVAPTTLLNTERQQLAYAADPGLGTQRQRRATAYGLVPSCRQKPGTRETPVAATYPD